MTDPLTLDTYVAAAKPIPSGVPAFDVTGAVATWPTCTVTLVSGRQRSVLVDTLMTTAEVEPLVRWVREHRSRLQEVYITHPHADHLYGLGRLLSEFPEARGVTLPSQVAAMIEQVSPAYRAIWNGLFPEQLPQSLATPEATTGDVILLDGHELRLVGVGRTDTEPSSVVHIPDLQTVVAGDVAYDDVHLWMAGSTAATRKEWTAALDLVEALHPATIVAGHASPDASDRDAARILDQTRAYVADFDDAAGRSDSPGELVDRMLGRHGGRRNPYTLWLAAWDQLGPRA